MQQLRSSVDLGKITALLLSAAFLLLANGLQGTLVPLRADFEGFSDTWIGILGSAYFAGFVAGCLFCPQLIGRVGHIRTFAILAALTAAVVLAHPIAFMLKPYLWTALRALIGFFAAGLFTVVESWLNHTATNENRGRVFSTYVTVNLAGLMGGQYLFSIGDTWSYELFTLVAMLTIAALVPVSMSTQPEPDRLGAARLRFTHLLKTSQVAFMTCIAMGLASGAFWTIAPVFAKAHGLVTDEVAAFMAITILGGGLSQWPLGRLSDYMDRRFVILGCAGASAIAGLMLAFSDVGGGVSKIMLFGGAFLFGAASFPIGSLANALMNDNAPRHEMTEVAGGVLLIYGASAIVGPIAAALIIGALDYGALFYFTAAVHAALAAVVVVRLLVRAPVPPHERSHFEAQPQANAGLLAPAEAASNT
jgi:MFS family permease